MLELMHSLCFEYVLVNCTLLLLLLLYKADIGDDKGENNAAYFFGETLRCTPNKLEADRDDPFLL